MNLRYPQPNGVPNKRKSGRLACEELRSSLGPVIDLSSEGCRILHGRFGGAMTGARVMLRLEGYECCVSVPAEIMRRNPHGLLKVEIGLRFVNLTQGQRDEISALARTHRVRYAIIHAAA